MADQASTLQHHRTVFDGWRSCTPQLGDGLAGPVLLRSRRFQMELRQMTEVAASGFALLAMTSLY
jgi:hypothetical protein